jgi:hypothetical protein
MENKNLFVKISRVTNSFISACLHSTNIPPTAGMRFRVSSLAFNSNIQLTFDTTKGSQLGVTCNTTPQQPYVSGNVPGTSFTISVPANFKTNPGCIGYHIKN